MWIVDCGLWIVRILLLSHTPPLDNLLPGETIAIHTDLERIGFL